MKVNNKKYILISIIIVLVVGLFLINNKSNAVKLDEVNLKKIVEEKGMFAIMLQKVAGEDRYTQSGEGTWPSSGYEFNSKKSGCLDSDGKKIENVTLSYEEGKVKVETVNTSYCYIYFDIEATREGLAKICKDIDMNNCVTNKSSELNGIESLNNGNKGDLAYRYVGTQELDTQGNIKNYACFGDESCSAGAIDNHMYRIIGITEDGKIKLQKNNSIELANWGNYQFLEVIWEESRIYNTTLAQFYNNETYVTEAMKEKIENHTWNTGDLHSDNDEPTGEEVYNAEVNIKEHKGYYGLAYASDYYFAYDETGETNCYTSSPDYCKSWMIPNSKNLWNNESSEWTMIKHDYGGAYSGVSFNTNGMVDADNFNREFAIRPVFYLTDKTIITSGIGTSENPYILK